MRKLMFTAGSLVLAVICIYAQNNPSPVQGFVPFHQYLQQHHLTFQKQDNYGRSLNYGEIAFRHDQWNGPSGAWAYSDSGQYTYNPQKSETGNILYKYSASLWSDFSKVSYTYDDAGNNLTWQMQNWNNGNWVNYTCFAASYNSANKPLTQTYQMWAGGDGGWLNTDRFIYNYDAANNLVMQIDQTWDATTLSWLNFRKYLHNYENGKLQSDITQRWNSTTGAWQDYDQVNYQYDASGNQIMRTDRYWTQPVWTNYVQYQYAYDSNNNDTLEITQTWDAASGSWLNQDKYIYGYDAMGNRTLFGEFNWSTVSSSWLPYFNNSYSYNAGLVTEEADQTWNSGTNSWQNSYKGDYIYDQNSDNTQYVDYYWDQSNARWIYHTETRYNFDADNNRRYELDQWFDTAAAAFVNTDQYFFYYEMSAPANIAEPKNELLARVYPNPTSGQNINLQLSLNQEAELQLNTYDANGRLISSETRPGIVGAGNLVLSYSNIASGIYFIQLTERNSGKTSVLKFVKE